MIEQDVFNTLQALVGGRCYPMVAPENVQTPYIVYMNISNSPENILSGPPPIGNTRMQVDCYEQTAAAVYALRASVLAAMQAASFANVQKMNQDIYEAEVKLFRVLIDFSIWE